MKPLPYPLVPKFTIGEVMGFITEFAETGELPRAFSVNELVGAANYFCYLNDMTALNFRRLITDETDATQPGWDIIYRHERCGYDVKYMVDQDHMYCLHMYIEKTRKHNNLIGDYVIRNGYTKTFRLMLTNGYKPPHSLTKLATELGHVECLKLMHHSPDLIPIAIKNGHVDCLQILLYDDYEIDEWSAVPAAENGHLKTLKYLHLMGFDMSECMAAAAGEGHLDCVKYLHSIGCKFDYHVICKIIENDCLECLQFYVDKGNELEDYMARLAATAKSDEILNYLEEQGIGEATL